MELERRVRWLQFWVKVLGGVAIATVSWPWVRSTLDDMKKLTVTKEGDTLRLYTSSDGPFVVTHVVGYGYDESEKRWAALPSAIAIIDSGSVRIDLAKLKWYDMRNEPANAPTNQRMQVLYSRPLVARDKADGQ